MSEQRRTSLIRRFRQYLVVRRLRRRVYLGLSIAEVVTGYEESKAPRSLASHRRTIVTRVRDLATQNAADEGSGDALDRLVDAWEVQELTGIDRKYLARRTLVEELLIMARTYEGAAREREQSLVQRRDHALATAQAAQKELLGDQEAADAADTDGKALSHEQVLTPETPAPAGYGGM